MKRALKIGALGVLAALFAPTAPHAQTVTGYAGPFLATGSADLSRDGFDVGGNLVLNTQFSFGERVDAALALHAQTLARTGRFHASHLPREAFLTFRGETVDFAIGKKIFSYGVADGFRPSDVASPRNFRFLGFEDDANQFGIWSASARAFLGDATSLEVLYSPYHESSIPPRPAIRGPWPSQVSGRRDSLGARLDHQGAGVDLGLTLYSGAAQTPVLVPRGATFRSVTPTLRMIAVDAVHVSGPFRFFAEAAYLHYRLKSIDAAFAPKDEVSLAGGVEYELSAANRVLFQVFHRQALGSFPAPANPIIQGNLLGYGQTARQQTGYSVTLKLANPDDSLSAELSAATWAQGGDLYLRGRVKMRIDDDQSIYGGLDHFSGPADTVFGAVSDTSRVTLEYRRFF